MMRKTLMHDTFNVVKKHYFLFVFIILIAAFIGTEFNNSQTFTDKIPVVVLREESRIAKENLETGSIEEYKTNVSIKNEELKNNNHNKTLGHNQGILAYMVNLVGSRSIYMIFIETIISIGGSTSLSIVLLITFSCLIIFVLWYYFINPFQVILRRIFMEGITYDRVPFHRILYLFKSKKIGNVANAMFRLFVYEFLWAFTIIGYIIKRYQYFMVPFILAENPAIDGKEAIKISTEMMKGHKFECFKLDLSYLIWHVLSLLTLGFLDLLIVNPFKIASFSIIYSDLRKSYIKHKKYNYELLNDKYLFNKCPKMILTREYEDVISSIKSTNKKLKISKFKMFIVKNFGIDILSEEESKIFNKNQINYVIEKNYKKEIKGISYPTRLFPIKEKDKFAKLCNVSYLKPYSITSYILIFFSVAFLGWIWEVLLTFVLSGVFVNRGVIHGPILPIYGYGSLVILILLYRFRRKPLVYFLLSIMLCGILEYFSGWILEMHHGVRWWDYSGYFININGRICAEGLLVFGIMALCITYFVAPLLDNIFKLFNKNLIYPLCIILISIYILDSIISSYNPNTGNGITVNKVINVLKIDA